MGLLSFFKLNRHRESTAEASAAAAPDAVAAARTRARRRLIGATVLLGLGVIGFPLLFETQPRPIPVNIPIEIPRKDDAPRLVLPPATQALSPPAVASATGAPADAAASAAAHNAERPLAPSVEIAERAGDQGRELPTPATTSLAKAAVASRPLAAAQAASAAKPNAAASKAEAARSVDEGVRAQALLDGQPAASAATLRLVVQVGAYSDAGKLGEARQKVEKLGLKTYTQLVEVDGAKRTRVRVGPFASRAEADKAAARIKAVGLPVAILTL